MDPLVELLKRTLSETLREVVGPIVADALAAVLPAAIRRAATPPYLDRKGLAEFTGWSERKISYMKARNQLPFVQHGTSVRYPTEEIEAMLREGYVPAKGRRD